MAIYNVTIRGFHDGIYLEKCRGVYISGVHVKDSRYGLHVMFSRNITAVGLVAEGNYVGAAVLNSTMRRNINWAEGYGLFIADISGGLFSGLYRGQYPRDLYPHHGRVGAGNASVVIARNVVADNYIGLTYRGADVPGYAVVDNVFLGNSMPAVYVDIFLRGGGLKHVVVRGNAWQGHTSTAPYIYRSFFAEALATTDFLLSPLSSSPARFLMDSMGVGGVAFVDPEPKLQPSSIDPAYLAALVAVALLLLARR